MIRFIIFPFIATVVAVFIRESDVINQGGTILRIFLPLLVIPIIVLSTSILYNAQKGIIKDASKFNKYKLSPNNILIKLRLFKYNNDTNWVLIIPYLIVFCISFLTIFLYWIYMCGALKLRSLLESSWFGGPLFVLLPMLILYYAIIRQIILGDCKNEKLDFTIHKNDKTKFDK